MEIKAQRRITYKNRTHEPGDIFEVPQKEAEALIKQGHAVRALIARESQDPGDDIVEE